MPTPCQFHGLHHKVWYVGSEHLDEPQVLQYTFDHHPSERRKNEVVQQRLVTVKQQF